MHSQLFDDRSLAVDELQPYNRDGNLECTWFQLRHRVYTLQDRSGKPVRPLPFASVNSKLEIRIS